MLSAIKEGLAQLALFQSSIHWFLFTSLFTFPSIRPVSSDLLRILYVPGTLQSPRDTAVRNPDIVHYLFG